MKKPLIAFLLSVSGVYAHADAELQQFLEQTLTEARNEVNLPAVAALIAIDGQTAAQAAVGVRALRMKKEVTVHDRWHLGADTKAMTATMIARLVDADVLSFEGTLEEYFPGIAPRMHEDLRAVTLAELLTHTSGLATLSNERDLTEFTLALATQETLRAQRAAVAVRYLTRPPASRRGEFAYSNLGYVIAGAIAESRTGRTWEELIESEVWKPLGIRNAGFGAPRASRKYGQPMGHLMFKDKLVAILPSRSISDNPPALGPAGTVHMTLQDWLLFAQDQLDGANGKGKLLKPETYKRLQTPVTRNYAMGWGAIIDQDGNLSALAHTGSNGNWIADARIMPKKNMIFLVVMNVAGPPAEGALRSISQSLRDRLQPL